MNAHTPTPWRVQHEEHNEWLFNIVQSIDEGNVIAGPFVRRTSFAKDDIALANAAFICHAVNSRDKLVEALQNLVALVANQDVTITRPGVDIEQYLAKARAALAAESEAK